MDFYRSVFVEPWPFWAGGLLIGLLVPLMYFFVNKPLGVSTGYGNVVKLLMPKTKLKWLNSEKFKEKFSWRIFFLLGMLIGAFISARLSGKPILSFDMGVFTNNLNWSFVAYGAWFLVGGLFLGLGSRISGGCTSGHSIHGISNLHLSSILSTIFFLLFGIISVYLMRTLLLGGI